MSDTSKTPIPRFTVVTLGVDDMRTSIAFYEALGFARKFRATGEAVAFFDTGATVLGNILIGHHVKIGAGSVVVRPAPDYSTVVGVPGHIVRARNEYGELEHGKLPDPEGQAIEDLARRVQELEAQLRALMAERMEHEISRKA